MKTALVVDDEASDLDALEQALTAAGYDVLTANNGNSALEIFRAEPEAIDLLVTDVVMSPMMGTELAKLLVNQKPNLKVIFVSGYIGALAFEYRRPIPRFGFLRKPFTQAELASQIRQTLEEMASRSAA
jgi:DNA-binding NtrC family response regulator